ncbi:SDR family oxidoreductase [Oceanobacillus jeddahense]|uniref:SDR family oxidoreductase n=1 Tax=Oceanobacillus jeddahense TaxID=1462527 RepID=A0ABY5JT84_9BACI|nr:SDR family oxidoreductase [Oceanobacillus jeddahense]UUI03004.1 SDR family oxidoreductase [Oceanobacillus jeddahense]
MSKKWINLEKKVIIVTGGSSGIGERMVENLCDNGAQVVIADLHENDKFKFNKDILFVECNVAQKESVNSMVQTVVDKYGKIDGLVNNAGVSRPRLLVDYHGTEDGYELTEEDFDFMVNVNQKGVFLCSQAVAKQMATQNSGVIVNMSSEAGIEGSKGQSAYSATKAAVHAFTLSWAKELGHLGIRVVGVAPGINERTPMNNDENFKALAYARGTKVEETVSDYTKIIPLGRPGKLEEVADLISYLVSDHSSYITGTTINITGGKSRG